MYAMFYKLPDSRPSSRRFWHERMIMSETENDAGTDNRLGEDE
jgi:hypothetical protein